MAYPFAAAHGKGLEGSAAWTAAVAHAEAHDWLAASQALWAAVAPTLGPPETQARLAGPLELVQHPH